MLRKILTSAFFCSLFFNVHADEIKVLTIGNSFAESVFVFLPQIADSVPGCKLLLERANIGGSSLKRHWDEHLKSIANPKKKIYSGNMSLVEKLTSQKWDIITIQQVSVASWSENSYQPYADNIIGLIRKYAPQAEIVIQQTWSYRADDPRLIEGNEKSWNMDQNKMFARLEKCYRKLAEKYQLRVIPTGLAIQLSRQELPVKFQPYDLAIIDKLNWPDLPPQAGDVVGDFKWIKRNGKFFIKRDSHHLNARGQYLQACLWFAFIFNRPCSEIKFIPENIDDKDALMLQKIAQKALDTYVQVKK